MLINLGPARSASTEERAAADLSCIHATSSDRYNIMMGKALISDDGARVRQMLRQMVTGLDSAAYEASGGGETITICATERPDGVMMGLRLKPMDGRRGAVQIKARFPETRIAVVTHFDKAELRVESMRVGACAYVLKENLLRLPAILMKGLPPGNGSPPTSTAEVPLGLPSSSRRTERARGKPIPALTHLNRTNEPKTSN